jgi:ATP-binding protein involved in chromosome partitioning
MARRSYLKVMGVIENMTAFVAPDGSRHPIFGEGGGAALAGEIDVSLIGQVPIEPDVSAGGDAGKPVVLSAPDGPAGAEFRRIASRIVHELLPPLDLSSCTARIFDLAQTNLAAKDDAAR